MLIFLFIVLLLVMQCMVETVSLMAKLFLMTLALGLFAVLLVVIEAG